MTSESPYCSPCGPIQSQYSLLYPGPDGPLATERYENVREGLLMTEALLFIERAIQSKKLSPELQERADKALDARRRGREAARPGRRSGAGVGGEAVIGVSV